MLGDLILTLSVKTDSWWNDNNPLLGEEGYPPNVIPSNKPTLDDASAGAEIAFFFIAGAAAVIFALPWAVRAVSKHRNWVPLIVLAGGLICSLEEAMLDMLGHLHWAPNLQMVYTNFGVSVPALIPLCYVAFLGMMSYFCYFVIRNGAKLQHYFMLLAMGGILDAVMETIGINLGVYKYYGVQPFEFLNFPYWWAFINSASFVAVGALLAYFVPRLTGWRKIAVIMAPSYGMAGTYFTVGWIHLIAHNSALPEWARWVAAAAMMVEACFFMVILHHLQGRKADEPALAWTLGRMFRYVLVPGKSRDALWAQMEREGGLVIDRDRQVRELVAC
ncbi:hypothetical protein [Nocardioides sp. Root190]|uniref:hypothetical protein n=1 Tax=Nocardioides sp. Root190 TaxID=1736488 RepID=UPI000AA1FBFD|nr:hypothetical protein [Nocardioides sp. Root190]